MRDKRQFWSARRIGEDRVTLVRLGPLRLWMARADKEWGVAFEEGELGDIMDIAQVPEDVVPEDLDWNTTLYIKAPREYVFRPTVPDRPVVVKPSFPVLIPEGESGLFYCLLPIFLQVNLSTNKEESRLVTVPSRKLSDTWFGTPTEGELCYSLPFTAERDLPNLKPLPHHLICAIEVENQSPELLKFEKLCFRPQYVGIYCGDSHLWSSHVKIRHEGSYKGTTIQYMTTPSQDEPNLLQLAKPLKREERSLSRLTFSSAFAKDIIFGK